MGFIEVTSSRTGRRILVNLAHVFEVFPEDGGTTTLVMLPGISDIEVEESYDTVKSLIRYHQPIAD